MTVIEYGHIENAASRNGEGGGERLKKGAYASGTVLFSHTIMYEQMRKMLRRRKERGLRIGGGIEGQGLDRVRWGKAKRSRNQPLAQRPVTTIPPSPCPPTPAM